MVARLWMLLVEVGGVLAVVLGLFFFGQRVTQPQLRVLVRVIVPVILLVALGAKLFSLPGEVYTPVPYLAENLKNAVYAGPMNQPFHGRTGLLFLSTETNNVKLEEVCKTKAPFLRLDGQSFKAEKSGWPEQVGALAVTQVTGSYAATANFSLPKGDFELYLKDGKGQRVTAYSKGAGKFVGVAGGLEAPFLVAGQTYAMEVVRAGNPLEVCVGADNRIPLLVTCRVACGNDVACDDRDAGTQDSCEFAGGCLSYCKYTQANGSMRYEPPDIQAWITQAPEYSYWRSLDKGQSLFK